MFRLGGAPSADGVGITSGMRRTGFQKPIDATAGNQEIIEGLQEQIMTKPKYGFNELIADAYKTSKGATDWRDWVNQASDRALEIQDERKGLPAKQLEQMLAIKKHQTDRLRATTDPTLIGRQNLLVEVTTMINEWKKKNPTGKIEDFLKSGSQLEIDAKIRGANPSFPGIATILQQVEDIMSDFTSVNRDADPINDVSDEEIKIERERLLGSLLGQYLAIGNAYGGRPRVARAFGNPNPTMTESVDQVEQIATPQGDMTMSEDVSMTEQLPGQASQDPYVILRARLPQEIPDDVVRLIAYNPDAFADFASIETQEDVIAFNQQYGVELVVNTDEVTA